jgi:hypothetical protein
MVPLQLELVPRTARSSSPELAPPRPPAPSRCPPSLPHVRSSLASVEFVVALASPWCKPHARSCSVDRIRASSLERRFSAAARRLRACVRAQPSDLEPTAQICSDPSQPLSVPVNTAFHHPFCKRNPDLPLFHAYALPQFKSNKN